MLCTTESGTRTKNGPPPPAFASNSSTPTTVTDKTDSFTTRPSQKKFRDDSFFPDPHPSTTSPHHLRIDDVSRMSSPSCPSVDGTPVSRLLTPSTEADVIAILRAASLANVTVGVRGTKHSMGGHSIVSRSGWEIDTRFLNHISYSPQRPKIVKCGPGCTWADLIRTLNPFGKSPRTMQSYATFSVGGTLAVNAHGITTDFCFAESVVEFRLVGFDPKDGGVRTVVCRPKPQKEDVEEEELEEEDGATLFGLALGGYGLFGIITEVTLKVVDNMRMELDALQLSVRVPKDRTSGQGGVSEFRRVYDNCRNCGDDSERSLGRVEVRLARLNVVNVATASLYVFRPVASSPVVSSLDAHPRALSATSRLLYKWAAPLLKDVRYAVEESTGRALDWDGAADVDRNSLLYESAVPLSRLYDPLVRRDDTFVLQEYFCPHDSFERWIERCRPVFLEIDKAQSYERQDVILLNTTIRYVEMDDRTVLSYSRSKGGSFAFVLYWRVRRDPSVDAKLGQWHNRLAEITVDLGGTFYLPYRRCYPADLLKRAYPMIGEFARMKERYDPNATLANLWFEEYVLPLCSEEYRKRYAKCASPATNTTPIRSMALEGTDRDASEFLQSLPRRNDPTLVRRTDSWRKLLRSKELRDDFRRQFLVKIFNVAVPDEVMRVATSAAWDPMNDTDLDVYTCLRRHFHGEDGASFDPRSIPRIWRGLRQISAQKRELLRQTLGIVSRLGRHGRLQNYLSIGDAGKTIQHFAKQLRIGGKLWLVHDRITSMEEREGRAVPPLEVVLERGSLDPVADEEISYDYCRDDPKEILKDIPSGSVDLITMNQGLHHVPVERLHGLLMEIRRMLTPSVGIFVVREHDLCLPFEGKKTDGRVPCEMLDLAHSAFNAVTGVSIDDERGELRAFRPLSEWRTILESVGFADSMVCEVEDGDPTWDVMMAFTVPSEGRTTESEKEDEDNEVLRSLSYGPRRNAKDDEPPIVTLSRTLLSQVPSFVVSNIADVLRSLRDRLPSLRNQILDVLLIGLPYLASRTDVPDSRSFAKKTTDVLEPKATSLFDVLTKFVEGLLSLLSQSELNESVDLRGLGEMPELFLILPWLERKVTVEGEEVSAVEKKMVDLVRNYLPALLPVKRSTAEESPVRRGGGGGGEKSSSSIEKPKVPNDAVVGGTEVGAFVRSLTSDLPDLLNPDVVLVQSGFTLPQQTTMVGQFGGRDFTAACDNFAAYLTGEIWTELRVSLKEAAATGDLPTKKRLLDATVNHPWRGALRVFLKSPHIELKQRTLFGLRVMGLSEMVTLYNEVKAREASSLSGHGSGGGSRRYDDSVVNYLKSVNSSLSDLGEGGDIVERTITYNNNDGIKSKSLWDVAEVIEAKFGYNSLTSRKVDVTKRLKVLYHYVHSGLPNPLFNFQLSKNNVPVGWLPIDEGLLSDLRNKGNKTKERGDSFRKSLVTVATLGNAGNNQLIIKYRRTMGGSYVIDGRGGNATNASPSRRQSRDSTCYVISTPRVGRFYRLEELSNDLCSFLEAKSIVRPDLHPNDGLYTWFKMNEWMQVEILDELVKSLDHTPWYRFPYGDFLKTYLDTFKEQSSIVSEKYGFMAAYGSLAFITDLIPFIVMSLLFGQLRLLAAPLQLAMPNGYSTKDPEKFSEEIVMRLPVDYNGNWETFLRGTIDERIRNVRTLPDYFVILSTPTFKAMGEILEKIAVKFSTAIIFQISNQKEVQLRVSTVGISTTDYAADTEDRELQMILTIPGVLKKMDFQYPTTRRSNGNAVGEKEQERKTTHHCLQVRCLALLEVYRICTVLSCCNVEQVYDFWN